MLPDVQQYTEAMQAAANAYDEAYKAIDKEHHEAGTRYNDPYYESLKAANQVKRDAEAAAWDALKASEDPFVNWVANNCGEYRNEATIVLKNAPYADADALEAVRADYGWCGDWHELHARAEAAGVIPGVVPLSPEREALVAELSSTFGVSRTRSKKLMGLLDAVYGPEKSEPRDA